MKEKKIQDPTILFYKCNLQVSQKHKTVIANVKDIKSQSHKEFNLTASEREGARYNLAGDWFYLFLIGVGDGYVSGL